MPKLTLSLEQITTKNKFCKIKLQRAHWIFKEKMPRAKFVPAFSPNKWSKLGIPRSNSVHKSLVKTNFILNISWTWTQTLIDNIDFSGYILKILVNKVI